MVVRELVEHFDWTGPVGVGFPAVVRKGVVESAANIDESWIDVDADALFTAATGLDVHMINDADAAGLAEVRFGAGRGRSGVVMMLTFGTGIGSGLFIDGMLVPNTELGHLELDGYDAETPRRGERTRAGRPQLVRVGGAGRALPAPRRASVLARPVHRRRWSEQAVREVAEVHRHRHRDRPGADGEQCRHRRRRAERPSRRATVIRCDRDPGGRARPSSIW